MDDFFKKKFCDRCGKKLTIRIMSMFNQDCICPDCKEAERKDPRYKEACEADMDAIRHGNYNFKGIGWK